MPPTRLEASRNHNGPPRAAIICGLAIFGILYASFLLIAITKLAGLRAANPACVWTPSRELPQAQFAMFWYAGRLLIMHAANMIGAHMAPSPWMLATFQVHLTASLHPLLFTWLYPPTMGLLAMLYALLPLGLSFWAWRALYVVISAALLRAAGLAWPVIAMGLAGPATMVDLLGGENGLLTGGILVSCLLLAARDRGAGGALAGLLAVKPQLGLLVPLALAAGRRWPALARFGLCAGALALATLPLEGWAAWRWFFSTGRHAAAGLVTTPFEAFFPAIGDTVFYMARSFGAGLREAWALQLASSLAGALLTWRVWRLAQCEAVHRMAITVCLTVLVVPYGFLYDLVGFSVAMAALFHRAPPAARPVYAALWLFTGYSGILAALTGHILMPVAAAAGALMVALEMRRAASPSTRPAPLHAHSPASAG